MSSRIYIFSPCGPVRDRAAFQRGIQRLIQMGYAVDIDPDALSRASGRLAGTDEQRLASIERAAHSGADVALITRGGYGAMRLLPYLPYPTMAQAAQKGLRWMGLSDFTAIQLALLAKTGALSYAGPALCGDFGVIGPMHRLTQKAFETCLRHPCSATGLAWSARFRTTQDTALDWPLDWQTHLPVVDSLIEGPLWGGNLTMLAALLGTPYFPVISGGILFVEDVNEPPWRVERLLLQLLHAGVLTQQKAILFGSFTQYRLLPADRGHGMTHVVQWLRGELQKQQTVCPVITGLPFGHGPAKQVLPIGQSVRLGISLSSRSAPMVTLATLKPL
jgi:muramoyltetrapeptide carboxypeptidase